MVSSDPTGKNPRDVLPGDASHDGLALSVMKWMMGSMYFSNMGLSSADSCLRRLSSQTPRAASSQAQSLRRR